jgi:hypothetical protein
MHKIPGLCFVYMCLALVPEKYLSERDDHSYKCASFPAACELLQETCIKGTDTVECGAKPIPLRPFPGMSHPLHT